MPEFQMDTSGHVHVPNGTLETSVRWEDLDEFTGGYIEAMFFTENSPGRDTETWRAHCEDGTNDGALPDDVGFNDLAPDSLQKIMNDCREFQEQNEPALSVAYERDYTDEQAGRDFWFTRNGHGAGFWCRETLESEGISDRLSEACGRKTKFREVSVYFGDDDLVYADTM